MKNLDQLHKDFGAFYPTGHTVVAFPDLEAAHQVLHELRLQGLAPGDSMELMPEQMAEFAEKNLHEVGFLAGLGTSVSTLRTFLDAAHHGATFLILATPDDASAERVKEAIHHVSFVLAERYHRLAIETLH